MTISASAPALSAARLYRMVKVRAWRAGVDHDRYSARYLAHDRARNQVAFRLGEFEDLAAEGDAQAVDACLYVEVY